MRTFEKIKDDLLCNKRTWLITGVAGFIGSNLLEELIKLQQKVIGLDNFLTGYRHNLDQALEDAAKENPSPEFTFIEGDITKLSDCERACHGVDYVLHQAALGSVPRSLEDPIKSNLINTNGFLNMLLAAKNAKAKKFVYAGSSSVYGDHPNLPKVENEIGAPLSPYAVTKLTNELYADVFSKCYQFSSIGLRYFNVFGKRQDPASNYAAVIPKWISLIMKGEKVSIYGDGETTRDFCHIDNVVQANLLAALSNDKEAQNQIYNIALNDRTNLNYLFKLIQNATTRRMPNLEKNIPNYEGFREGDIHDSQAEVGKAKKLLGYNPMIKVSEGIEKTVDWFVSQQ